VWEVVGSAVDGCGAEGRMAGAILGVGAMSRTGSKPVPSDGSPSVPSPSFDFSALITSIRRASKAKSVREDAICFDISHGENALPECAYVEK